jgi:hypothetical protein
LIQSGHKVDFRRILKINSEIGDLNDYLIDLSMSRPGSMSEEFDVILSEKYERCDDGSSVIVKSVNGLKLNECFRITIENLLNLCHPCILSLIGFIIRRAPTISEELQIVRFFCGRQIVVRSYFNESSVVTSTAKAKAIAGIVLSLRFCHGLGLIHGHLNLKHIVFEVDHRIQISDFSPTDLRYRQHGTDGGVLSDEGWSMDADIRGFALIPFEIVVAYPLPLSEVLVDETIIRSDLPMFVSIRRSFNNILDLLKNIHLRIVSGVDSVDVLTFLQWVESYES